MTEPNQTNSDGANRPIQIIPSVLPADWANMGSCVKELEKAKKILSSNNVNSITFKQTIESKSM